MTRSFENCEEKEMEIVIVGGGDKISCSINSDTVWTVIERKFRRICENFFVKTGRKPNIKERQKIFELLYKQTFTI